MSLSIPLFQQLFDVNRDVEITEFGCVLTDCISKSQIGEYKQGTHFDCVLLYVNERSEIRVCEHLQTFPLKVKVGT